MLLLGIMLCYMSGVSAMLLCSRRYTFAEWLGYSFLIGIMLESVFLFLLDVVYVPYSQGVLIGLNLGFIAAVLALQLKNIRQEISFEMPVLRLHNVNLPALFVLGFIAWLFYVITVKNLFWPPTEHDTIGSFDKLGRVMALEGKLKISLFDHNLQGAGGLYPPLYHASFAYVYIFGAVMPKILTTLFFLSLLSVFYAAVSAYSGALAAALFTFLFMVTPELFSHAALSLGNLPTTAYIAAAILPTILWLDRAEKKYFWLGALMLGGVTWIRSDTVVFTAAAFLLLGIWFLKSRNWRDTALYYLIGVLPFVVWMLYMKLKIGVSTAGKFDLGIGYNAERMNLMTGYIKAFLLGGQKGNIDGGQLYGVVFVFFFIVIILNTVVWAFRFNRDREAGLGKMIYAPHTAAFLFSVVSFILYFILFYLINEETQRAPMASLMESSFKRGMFFFIPAVLFYIAASPLMTAVFDKIERFRVGS